MSINEFSHYSLFPGLFLAFTYNKKEPPAFGAALSFWCILLPFLGLLFCHISNNLSHFNVLTANAPFFYQISGTWSNHEGSLLSWCWILSAYVFLLCYWGRPQSHTVSKQGGRGESLFCVFATNFVNKSRPSLPLLQRKPAARGRRKGDSPFLSSAGIHEKERVSAIHALHEQRGQYAVGIALFFSIFLSASSDPFVRNIFLRTEPLAESNPVPQDPISAIHPPCIYAGAVASAMGFGLCRSKIMNAIVALHSPPIQKESAEKKRTLLRSDQNKEKKTNKTLSWTASANTVVSDRDQEPIRIWILTCWWFLTVGILPGSWWAHHELGRGGWWFRDPVENASFMPRVLATARIHSVSLPILNSWTYLLNIVTLSCCVSGTSSIRSGLLASVHSFATDEGRGRFLWWFFLLMTAISISLFTQMKLQAARQRNYKKEMLVARKTPLHLRNSAEAQSTSL